MSSSASSSHDNYHYAILMETSGQECESWMNFIRYEGNEEALSYLQSQLDKVRFILIDDMSTFDLDLDHLVSEQTAREMCSVDLNAYMFHRKFDGQLRIIDFKFSRKDRNEDRIAKVHELLGLGDIDQFVDGEDPCEDGYELHSGSDESTHVEESTALEESSSSASSEEEVDRGKRTQKGGHRRRPYRK
jgi:hypothetical protein